MAQLSGHGNRDILYMYRNRKGSDMPIQRCCLILKEM
jgi:hypothetical protein